MFKILKCSCLSNQSVAGACILITWHAILIIKWIILWRCGPTQSDIDIYLLALQSTKSGLGVLDWKSYWRTILVLNSPNPQSKKRRSSDSCGLDWIYKLEWIGLCYKQHLIVGQRAKPSYSRHSQCQKYFSANKKKSFSLICTFSNAQFLCSQ